LWLGHGGPSNAQPLPVPEDEWWSKIRATLADEKGEEWETRSGTAQFSPINFRGLKGVSSWDFSSLPRRGNTLRFILYARNNLDGWDKIAELNLPNPRPGPYPVWKGSNLPVSQKSGNLEVSLVSLISGTKAVQNYPGERPYTMATFEVKENGQPTEAWLPDRMDATDATANEPWPPVANYRATNGLVSYEIQGTSLSPSEVWRLRMRFLRDKDVARNQMWTSPELAVQNKHLSSVNLTTNFQAYLVTLKCSPTNNTIHLKLNPPPKDARLHMTEIFDNRGRKLEYISGGLEDSGFTARWRIPVGTEWIKVAIGLAEIRMFEFVARPTRQ
jgi:hypothetical protein